MEMYGRVNEKILEEKAAVKAAKETEEKAESAEEK